MHSSLYLFLLLSALHFVSCCLLFLEQSPNPCCQILPPSLCPCEPVSSSNHSQVVYLTNCLSVCSVLYLLLWIIFLKVREYLWQDKGVYLPPFCWALFVLTLYTMISNKFPFPFWVQDFSLSSLFSVYYWRAAMFYLKVIAGLWKISAYITASAIS